MIWATSRETGMNDRFNGFILSQSDYREADVMMQVLSKEYGVITLIGKASKKLTSKNHFLPLCLYEFIIDYKEGSTIFTVHNQKLLENYFEYDNIEMMSFKNVLCELALKNKDIDSFDELCFVFRNLNEKNRYLLGSMYLSFLIKRFGITPVVDGCVICGNQKVVALSNRHGGFLCMNHLNGEEILAVDTLRKFRLIIKGEFRNYDVLKDFEYEYKDFALLMDFYLENSDMHLKSYDFYRTVI